MVVRKNPDMFWTRVQERMDEVGIPSIRELEKMAGVSNGTISVRKNQLKMPTVVIAEGLCRALRWTWVELWARAGYVPPGTLDTHIAPEELELIDHFRRLNPDRREAALNMMRGLVQGMTGHYTFIAADENALDAACFRAIVNLADEENGAEAISKIQSNTTRRQQLGVDRKLDRIDAEDEAQCGTGAELGGSRTS